MQTDYPGAEAHFLPADRFGYPNNNGLVALVIHKTGEYTHGPSTAEPTAQRQRPTGVEQRLGQPHHAGRRQPGALPHAIPPRAVVLAPLRQPSSPSPNATPRHPF